MLRRGNASGDAPASPAEHINMYQMVLPRLDSYKQSIQSEYHWQPQTSSSRIAVLPKVSSIVIIPNIQPTDQVAHTRR